MALKEAYAEKFRAAVSRREPAIRDFFDLAHAVRVKALNCLDPDFLVMVKTKLEVEGNAPVALSPERIEALRRQVEAQLKPVLRPRDVEGFNLEDALELVRRIQDACEFGGSS